MEIPFHWNPSQPVEPLRQGKLHLHADGSWKQTLPVGSDPELSLLSRWAIATYQEGTWNLLTHPNYVEPKQAPRTNTMEPITSQTRKGMGGVWSNEILEELVELGVGHITVNILLNQLINSQPRNGWPSFTHGQQTWAVSPAQSERLDRLIRFATQHQMVVSAILLIAWDKSETGDAMRHPEAESRPLCHAQPHGPRRHRSLWRRHRLADTSLRSAGRPLWPDLQLDPSQRN